MKFRNGPSISVSIIESHDELPTIGYMNLTKEEENKITWKAGVHSKFICVKDFEDYIPDIILSFLHPGRKILYRENKDMQYLNDYYTSDTNKCNKPTWVECNKTTEQLYNKAMGK